MHLLLPSRFLTRLTKLQGWTKFSKFGDLGALNEDEWDKVNQHKAKFAEL
jgi:hypothetical protein